MTRLALAAGALLAAACAVTPLTNKIDPGQEPFLIVIGEGADSQTDLFAASPAGGAFTRLTFSRPGERMARLSPSGTAVAFLRERSVQEGSGYDLVVLDLLTALEQRVAVPDEWHPTGLGWSADATRLYLAMDGTFAGTGLSPMALAAVTGPEAARADSATHPLLGDPPFAQVTRCGDRACVVTGAGDTTALDADVVEAFRWGPDSLGLLRGSEIEIRPLGGGRVRRPQWTDVPAALRSATYYPGPAAADSGR